MANIRTLQFASNAPYYFRPSDLSPQLFVDIHPSICSSSIDGANLNTTPGTAIAAVGVPPTATQAIAANRPILGVDPQGGRRNVLLYSSNLVNSVWTLVRSSRLANAAIDPDHVDSGIKLVEDLTVGSHEIYRVYSAFDYDTLYTFSIYAKAAERQEVQVRLNRTSTSNVFGTTPYCIANLTSQTLINVANVHSSSIEAVGNDWYRISVSAYSGSTHLVNDIVRPGVILSSGNTINYTPDGVSGMYFWGGQLETELVTPFQYVESNFACFESGKANSWYLYFDGINDSLTAPINLTGNATITLACERSSSANAAIADVNSISIISNGAYSINSITANTHPKRAVIQYDTSASLYVGSNNYSAASQNIIANSITLGANATSYFAGKIYSVYVHNTYDVLTQQRLRDWSERQ